MLKVCSNACNRSIGMSCCLVDKYFSCQHEQCFKTTLSIFYCIHCGCDEMDDTIFKDNLTKYTVLLHFKKNIRENKIKKY